MKFSSEKKNSIIIYILEKIAARTPELTKCVSEACNISRNTVQTYLRTLQNDQIIIKIGQGQYRLTSMEKNYRFSRSLGELDSDNYAFEKCIKPCIEDLSANAKEIWEYVITEMTNNVIDHSEAENLDITISQNCLKTFVIMADNGVGVFEKIKNHFNFSSIDESICELFKGKLTTDPNNHSGEGIFFSSRMMDTFLIYSSGKIFTTSKYNNDNIFNCENIPDTGTYIFMSLSNLTHKTARGVFDSYSNADGAFTTTRIPLKNIFEASPISRSQAKRVCARLDKFNEVIFDFDGFDWIGQAFAHQIFVVFQNEHPQIKLNPINMSETVRTMYHHVMASQS